MDKSPDKPVDQDVFFNFIYLFQAPKEDSNLVNIFEMSDLYYRSTEYKQLATKESTSDEVKNHKGEHYLNSHLTLNEEQFYTKLNDIIKTCIDVDVNKLYLLFTLLKRNYLIKTSS